MRTGQRAVRQGESTRPAARWRRGAGPRGAGVRERRLRSWPFAARAIGAHGAAALLLQCACARVAGGGGVHGVPVCGCSGAHVGGRGEATSPRGRAFATPRARVRNVACTPRASGVRSARRPTCRVGAHDVASLVSMCLHVCMSSLCRPRSLCPGNSCPEHPAPPANAQLCAHPRWLQTRVRSRWCCWATQAWASRHWYCSS